MRMTDIELLINNSWYLYKILSEIKLKNNLPIISLYKFYKTYKKQKIHILLK